MDAERAVHEHDISPERGGFGRADRWKFEPVTRKK
jgi:hypothetical protein